MQMPLAGPALITALPSTGGNGEGASFFDEAQELDGHIPHGLKSPRLSADGDAQSPGKEQSCQQGMQAPAHHRVRGSSIPK